MKSSKQTEREIVELQKRREAVAGSHAAACSDLQAARARMIKGQASPDEVGATQSAYNGLSGALGEADEQLSTLRAELAEATAREQREGNAARVNELTTTRSSLQAEYNGLQRHVSDILAREADKLLDLRVRYHAAAREIAQLSGRQLPTSADSIRDEPTEFGEIIGLAVGQLASQRDRAERKRAQAA
jgi:predicted  nucleic acid-binding Zn-ribbon protein